MSEQAHTQASPARLRAPCVSRAITASVRQAAAFQHRAQQELPIQAKAPRLRPSAQRAARGSFHSAGPQCVQRAPLQPTPLPEPEAARFAKQVWWITRIMHKQKHNRPVLPWQSERSAVSGWHVVEHTGPQCRQSMHSLFRWCALPCCVLLSRFMFCRHLQHSSWRHHQLSMC